MIPKIFSLSDFNFEHKWYWKSLYAVVSCCCCYWCLLLLYRNIVKSVSLKLGKRKMEKLFESCTYIRTHIEYLQSFYHYYFIVIFVVVITHRKLRLWLFRRIFEKVFFFGSADLHLHIGFNWNNKSFRCFFALIF